MNMNKQSLARKNVLDQEESLSIENPGWHSARIKMELEVRGWSLASLSREHGYSPTAAGRALRTTWPHMEQVIAEALGVEPRIIWPDRYDANGVPQKYKARRKAVKENKEGPSG